ncbi:MAG: hypothetical protein AAGH81_08685 [Bacteroidota bacterium]
MKLIRIISFACLQLVAINLFSQDSLEVIRNPPTPYDLIDLSRDLTNTRIKSLDTISQVGVNWVPFYNRKGCWFDTSDNVSIVFSRNGQTVFEKTYDVTYNNTDRLRDSQSSFNSTTYFFTIKTKLEDIDKNNASERDDYQYVISTQSNELLIVNDGLVIERIKLQLVSGTRSLFVGRTKNGEFVSVRMNECVIVD